MRSRGKAKKPRKHHVIYSASDLRELLRKDLKKFGFKFASMNWPSWMELDVYGFETDKFIGRKVEK